MPRVKLRRVLSPAFYAPETPAVSASQARNTHHGVGAVRRRRLREAYGVVTPLRSVSCWSAAALRMNRMIHVKTSTPPTSSTAVNV